nr:hypothetical protein [Tanacetum cinerariifolium]
MSNTLLNAIMEAGSKDRPPMLAPEYHPQNHPTHYTQNSSTRSQQAATWNRGKAIVNSSQPIDDQEPSMVADNDEMSKDKDASYHRENMLLCKQEEAGIQLNAKQAD